MNHGSLFSGIGGFDLAAEWMGWDNKFHCEWNEFGQKVLKYYFPKAESFNDITKTDFTKYANRIDVLTGGFPCQPYSLAGKRLGKEDERHLWPEMLRAIQEIRPRWVVGENVLGLVNWNGGLVFDEVQADLEAQGYEVQPYVLPAAAVNAPHRRDRVWFVAYSKDNGCRGREDKQCSVREWELLSREQGRSSLGDKVEGCCGERTTSDTESQSSERLRPEQREYCEQEQGKFGGNGSKISRTDWQVFPTVSPLCNGNDGISDRLDGITFSKWRTESVKAGGNAIVPQVALQIFKAIQEYEKLYANT